MPSKKNPNITVASDQHGFPRAIGLSFSDSPQIFTSPEEARVPRYPWQLFKGTGWPMSIDAEEEFLLDITVAAKGVASDSWERADATVLMAALRTSASWEEVSELLPGADPTKLLGVYNHLSAALSHALKGWKAICSGDLSDSSLQDDAAAASMVMSAAVSKLVCLDAEARQKSVEKMLTAEKEVRRSVDTIHTALEDVEEGCLEGVELGRLLFSVGEICLYADPCFVPQRVGELSPLSVSVMTKPHSEGI